MSKNQRTEAEILALIESEEQSAYGINDAELSEERAKAIDYYLGKPFGNEIEGRSQVVSSDVSDTVESILPGILETFVAGDKVVEFDPKSPEDVAGAEQETDAVNHIVLERNNGFTTFYTWFKDALLSKNGYVKVYWEEKEEVEREFYQGLTDDEFAIIANDSEVEIVEHTAYLDEIDAQQRIEAIGQLQAQLQAQPQMAQQIQRQLAQIQAMQPKMLHDVRVQTKQSKGCIEIDPVAPESMRIAVDTKTVSLQDARFVQHAEHKTIAELQEEGFDVSEDVGFNDDNEEDIESAARDIYGEDAADDLSAGRDRKVLVKDTYIVIDGERMRYVHVGNTILLEEPAEIIPFAAITPVIMPHRHVGRSVADLVMDIQLIKSVLTRGQLDGMFLALNPRTFINERVNLDDYLVSRPGGAVRVTGDVATAAMPVVTPDVSSIAYPMIEYFDGVKENRTGVTRHNQGLDPDSLNKTATGVQKLMTAGLQKQKMIARIFAETGVKELFMLVHRLMKMHSQREMVLRLRNEWVTVDPRQWKTRTDMTVSVGLGTGDKDQQMMHLTTILQAQKEGLALGLTTPGQIYNALSRLTQNAGFKNPQEFWTDPTNNPTPPPQENPIITVEKIKQQGEVQKFAAQTQLEREKTALEIEQQNKASEIEAARKAQEIELMNQLEALKAQNAMELERYKEESRMALEKYKAELASQTQIILKQMETATTVTPDQAVAADAATGDDPVEPASVLATAMMGFQAALERMNQPRQVIRGPDGRVSGIA